MPEKELSEEEKFDELFIYDFFDDTRLQIIGNIALNCPASYQDIISFLRQSNQRTREKALREAMEIVDKDMSIHRQLKEECSGIKIEGGQIFKVENPHDFVLEQLLSIRRGLSQLIDKGQAYEKIKDKN